MPRPWRRIFTQERRDKCMKYLDTLTFNAKWSNSLEPVIFCLWGGWYMVGGAEVGTDMLIRKMCEVGMNNSFDTCANLTGFKELNEDVTKEVNTFTMRGNLLKLIPPILISFVGGTLFNNFPKKNFLIIPIFFASLEPIAEFINYYFFYELPMEFMYLTTGLFSLGGGTPLWYLAVYGIISLVAKPEDRVGRLTRVDAMENLAPLIATPLSAPVLHLVGYCGLHGIKLVMYYAGLIYLVLVIKEPENCVTEKMTWNELGNSMVKAIKDMWKTVAKKRKGNMRALIFLQLLNLTLLNMLDFPIFGLNYLYVKTVFNVSGEQLSLFREIEAITLFLCLLIAVPIVSKYLSDSAFIVFLSLNTFAGFLAKSVAPSYLWWCVARLSFPLYYSLWCIMRSLLVASVDAEEIGRLFGVIAVLASLASLTSDSLFRFIFNITIKTVYPGVYLLVVSIVFFLISVNGIFLHCALKKEKLNENTEETIMAMVNIIETEAKGAVADANGSGTGASGPATDSNKAAIEVN